jgi:SAM-dependent methyltransferase
VTARRSRAPGWLRLWRHSYRLFAGWLLRLPRHRAAGARVALTRALVPLDPWRYYELGRVAEERFAGDCLDVSSPKLLPSLLAHEGQGEWTAVDLFEREVEQWAVVDPHLRMGVEDATQLSFPSESFDACLCVSVIEHVMGEGDAAAMAEMWRVLRPGGVLHLTTDIAPKARDIFVGEKIYGAASFRMDDAESVFFARQYAPEDLDRRLLELPWEVEHREFARQRDERWERRFYAATPWSYLVGGLLPLACARNFDLGADVPDLADRHHGVVYLRLRKPAAA